MEPAVVLSQPEKPREAAVSDNLLLWEHFRSTLLRLLNLSILILFFFIESYLIILKHQLNPFYHLLTFSSVLLVVVSLSYCLCASSPVYVVDYVCFKPPNFCRIPFSSFLEHIQMMGGFFDSKGVAFMEKILNLSGLSEQTYLPPALHFIPARSGPQDAINEVHMVLFPIFQQLLSNNKLSPKDIDILVVNCSGFCPDPSLASIIVNKFAMRADVKTFNLTGMGCSANTLAVDMVRNIMKTHRRCNAVILSTEILSTGWYPGKEKAFLVLNCIFRMGGAAVLLSNKREAKSGAKYKLLWSLRTQGAFDDRRYNAAIRDEDSEGLTGMRLNGDVLFVAGETLQTHIPILGAKFLPITEILRFLASAFKRKFIDKSTEIYVPNFKSAIQHFCFPATGKSVVRETAKRLKLGDIDMEAALMTLYRFGNQSSASLWYELAYLEAKERVKKGDKVWQLGMGTGPKCNSLVLQCIRPILGEAQKGPWADCIHKYPIPLS
ncbi:PREDICTED: 3-ketoacyl-CoA synthase 5-like [Ipomoea nil]|uniref:3-ketoacyl-CoA synthase 5-like n=1 Tax=Ipomoea nil TaxID=35883 RepID=UPI0009014C40|nr:PREDICTED: 3-ketoacyl-CoA synthase 5-like [Ipomoea nil]XP_019199888.1 PREDICTED: 3-ketoacyl-CoA synthase 5-like [Ipomoea nil]